MLADVTLTIDLEAEEWLVVDGVQRGLTDGEIAQGHRIPLPRVKAIISSLVLMENLVVATRGRWARWSNFRLLPEEADEEKPSAHVGDEGKRNPKRKTGG